MSLRKMDLLNFCRQEKGLFLWRRRNLEIIKEENLKKVEQYLEKAVKLSRTCGLTKDDLIDMIKIIGKDE